MASAMLVARQSAIDEALEKIQEFGVYGYQPSEVGAAIFTSGGCTGGMLRRDTR